MFSTSETSLHILLSQWTWIPQSWRAHPHEYATPIDPVSMETTNQYSVDSIRYTCKAKTWLVELWSSLWCSSVRPKGPRSRESQWCGFWPGGCWESNFSRQGVKNTRSSSFPYSVWISRAVAGVTSLVSRQSSRSLVGVQGSGQERS